MTDKQIPLDGRAIPIEQAIKLGLISEKDIDVLSDRPDWILRADHIKRLEEELKAKEQECERLKEGYSELTDIVNPYMGDFTGYNEELGGFDIVLCVKELMEQLDQLKSEVKSKTEYIQEQREIIDQYSKEIEMYKKCQGKRASKREEELKVENEELKRCYKNNSALLDFEETNTTKLVNKVMKLEKTLTEIKPVLEIYSNSKIGEILDDGRSMACLWSQDSFGFPIPNCANVYIYDPNPAKEALQKIREVIE